MSNRRKTQYARAVQSYRNAGKNVHDPKPNAKGQYLRGGGPNNFPYGALAGASPSVLSLHRTSKPGKGSWLARAAAAVVDYSTFTRDALRIAAKDAGVEGWHKMNKAALVAALTPAEVTA